MSKMSQLHAELEEQACEKGYESLDEALNDGATIIGETLVTKDDLPSKQSVDERQQAHEAWLEEKKSLVGDLRNLLIGMHVQGKSDGTDYAVVQHALEFIVKGEQ